MDPVAKKGSLREGFWKPAEGEEGTKFSLPKKVWAISRRKPTSQKQDLGVREEGTGGNISSARSGVNYYSPIP